MSRRRDGHRRHDIIDGDGGSCIFLWVIGNGELSSKTAVFMDVCFKFHVLILHLFPQPCSGLRLAESSATTYLGSSDLARLDPALKYIVLVVSVSLGPSAWRPLKLSRS